MRRTKEQYINEIKSILHKYSCCMTDVDIKEMGFKPFVINETDNKIECVEYVDEDIIRLDVIENDEVIDSKDMEWGDLTDRQAFMLFQIADQFRRDALESLSKI